MKIYKEKPRGIFLFSPEWAHLTMEKEGYIYIYIYMYYIYIYTHIGFFYMPLKMLFHCPSMKTSRSGLVFYQFCVSKHTKQFFLWQKGLVLSLSYYSTLPQALSRRQEWQQTNHKQLRPQATKLSAWINIQAGQGGYWVRATENSP